MHGLCSGNIFIISKRDVLCHLLSWLLHGYNRDGRDQLHSVYCRHIQHIFGSYHVPDLPWLQHVCDTVHELLL